MKFLKNNVTILHWIIFAVLLVDFMVLTYLAVDGGLDKGQGHDWGVYRTTALTITGPFTGAIARNGQSCCLKFSAFLALFCAPILLTGIALQFLITSERKWARILRPVLWGAAWLIWYLGGMVSFLHALG